MRFLSLAAAALTCLSLAACASTEAPEPLAPPRAPALGEPSAPPEPYAYAPPPIARAPGPIELAQLPGWTQDDHAQALLAYEQGCGAAHAPELALACRRARGMGALDEDQARIYLETHFRARLIGADGLLTAYFAPEYEARASQRGEFTAAVRAKPDDLVVLDLGAFDATLAGRKLDLRLVDGRIEPYADRAEIEAENLGQPVAWMRPEDLFFLQIQGSGVLQLPDGRRLKASFSASNGRPFVGLANVLRQRGALAADNTSGDAIHAWLADHRGPEADEVMHADPRYIFFHLAPDDGAEPAGSAGLPLVPGRALAVDPVWRPMGGFYWIDAQAPRLTGAQTRYQRLAMALDIGSAIKGPVRADLYLGRGAAAGLEAGRVRHSLALYQLEPVKADPAQP